MYYERLKTRHYRSFDTPHEFLTAAVEYFEWCDNSPLQEEQVFKYKGSIVRADRKKVRAYTRRGLASFLCIPASRLSQYESRGADWAEAVEMVDQIIYTQKFENAAANLLNSTLVARDLGLADKQEVAAGVTVNIAGKDAEL